MNATSSHLADEICDILRTNVPEIFGTMCSQALVPGTCDRPHHLGDAIVAASVGFTGEVNGIIYAYVTASYAIDLASRMLGLRRAEIEGDEMVNDVMGELSNMIVGSVKSRLCDSGSTCVLTIPSIVRGQNFTLQAGCSIERRAVGFECAGEHILVELLLKTPA
jgi:chemotaxis protein CheX